MLVIRKEQLAVLERDIRERIKAAAVGEIRAAPRPAGVDLPDDAGLRALVDRAEPRIDRYFGDLHRDASRFALLMLEFGAGFDAEPWAAQVLEDPDIPGSGKLDLLEVHVADRRQRRERSCR